MTRAMTRAERRWRDKIIYDRRAKLFYQTWLTTVPCDEDELRVQDKNRRINRRFSRPAESWKELQDKNETMHLYKNTGTIYDKGYWTKYERKRLNKQSRMNAKQDLKNGVEDIYERTNLK